MRWKASLCAVIAATLATGAKAEMRVAASGATQEGGIDLRWSILMDDAGEAGLGALEVAVSDSRTGAPVSYADGALLGWLTRTQAALIEPDPRTCADRVMALATQGIGQRGDVDLNAYRIVTLNLDGSLAFINPFVGFNNAKLESIIDLGAPPLDWVQIPDRMEYWVLLSGGRLVAVDLQRRAVGQTLDLAPDGGAVQVVADLEDQRLWVALPGSGQLASVDLRASDRRPVLAQTPGIARVFAASDGAALAWSDGAGVVTSLKEAWQVTLPSAPVALDHSASAAATVIAGADGSLVAQPDHGGEAWGLAVGHALGDMRLFDGGRRVLALGGGRASVVDLASRTVSLTFAVEPGASQIAMTEGFAYALGAASGRASMIALDDLIRARPQVVSVIVSNPAPQQGTDVAPVAVVAAPEGDGLLVSGRNEAIIYQYSEGMMAPSGSYSNYRRAPLAVGIVDFSLREGERGHYRAALRVPASGRYEVMLGGIGPRISSCATVPLVGAAASTDVARVQATLVSTAGDGNTLQVQVRITEAVTDQTDPRTLNGLRDVKLLVFDKRTGWQRRIALTDDGTGLYVADLTLPRQSRYELLASSPSANLSFVEGQMGEQLLGAAP